MDSAAEAIRADLARLRRRRFAAFAGFLSTSGLALAWTARRSPEGDLAIVALFFSASAASASVSLGVPLWRRSTASFIGVAATLSFLAAFVLEVDPAAPAELSPAIGARCLATGTALSVAAFAAGAILTRRLWRTMLDLAWVSAVGASAIGLALLNASCPHDDAVHLFGFHLPATGVLFMLSRIR